MSNREAEKSLDGFMIEHMTLEELVDLAAQAEVRVAELQADPAFATLKKAKEMILKKLENEEQTGKLDTGRTIMEWGKRVAGAATIKDIKEVAKTIGVKTFMEIVTVGIGDLRKYTTPDQFKELTEEGEPTLNRKLKFIRK